MFLQVGTGLATEVLLALLDAPSAGIGGTQLQQELASRLKRGPRSDELLVCLLGLEASGHVAVQRDAQMRFSLTERGRSRAYELGGGRPVQVRLLMADLVGYVAFTAEHGDEAARDAASTLAAAASAAIRAEGGEVVKGLGDGFLAWLPPTADPMPVLSDLAGRCARPSGERWRLRAATHLGSPISHGGDLFGADVNLVSRLCAEARPGELVVSRPAGFNGEAEHIDIRGMAEPVAVTRLVIA